MRIVCISDTHGAHDQLRGVYEVPRGDVLVHAGDMTNDGTIEDVRSFNDWLGGQPHRRKIVIAGNHDRCLAESKVLARALLTNAEYLQDSGCVVDGVGLWGSPWIRGNYRASNAFVGIPSRTPPAPPRDTDVLITHDGSAECLDFGVPWSEIRQNLKTYKIRMHVYGHSSMERSRLDCLRIYADVLEGHSFTPFVGAFPTVVELRGQRIKVVETEIQRRYGNYRSRLVQEAADSAASIGKQRKPPMIKESCWLDGRVVAVTRINVSASFLDFTRPKCVPELQTVRKVLMDLKDRKRVAVGMPITVCLYKKPDGKYDCDVHLDRLPVEIPIRREDRSP